MCVEGGKIGVSDKVGIDGRLLDREDVWVMVVAVVKLRRSMEKGRVEENVKC